MLSQTLVNLVTAFFLISSWIYFLNPWEESRKKGKKQITVKDMFQHVILCNQPTCFIFPILDKEFLSSCPTVIFRWWHWLDYILRGSFFGKLSVFEGLPLKPEIQREAAKLYPNEAGEEPLSARPRGWSALATGLSGRGGPLKRGDPRGVIFNPDPKKPDFYFTIHGQKVSVERSVMFLSSSSFPDT